MLFNDNYNTISSPSIGEYKDKGSKFIAYAYPINQEQEVKSIIANLKLEHPKARHHCWAWRLSTDRAVFKINDDGEPAGTAGRPILNTLLSFDVTNLLVVVVRYFGGTLLGVPGLINAYKSATQDALKQAQIITKTINDCYEIEFDYLEMNNVMRIVKEENVKINNQVFDNKCTILIEIAKSQLNNTLARLEKIINIKIKYIETK